MSERFAQPTFTARYEQATVCLERCGRYTLTPETDAGYPDGTRPPTLGTMLDNLADAWHTQGPDDHGHYPLGVAVEFEPGRFGAEPDRRRIDAYTLAHGPGTRAFRWSWTAFEEVPIEQSDDVLRHLEAGHTVCVWYPVEYCGYLSASTDLEGRPILDIADSKSGDAAGPTDELRCQTCDRTLPLDSQKVDIP